MNMRRRAEEEPMDWDLCKTFVAVAETRSFAAAARRLRSSHPTVGRKIAELEGSSAFPCSRAPMKVFR